MFPFQRQKTELIAEAHNLAAAQFARLQHHRSEFMDDAALSFLAREILRLHREGENDPERLAERAVSLLREHIQKRESASRIARRSEPH